MMDREYTAATKTENKPLYEKLVADFYRRITVGRWPVGKPLKTEAAIARELGVSLGTVRKAFERLETMHLIDRTPGRGTIVREYDCARRLARLTSIVDVDGRPVTGDIAIGSFQQIDANDEIAKELGIDVGAPAIQVERSRTHNGRTFMFEEAYFHPPSGSGPLQADTIWSFTKNLVYHGEIAVDRTEYVRSSDASDRCPRASFPERTGLTIDVRRTLYSIHGKPLEFSKLHIQLGPNLQYRLK